MRCTRPDCGRIYDDKLKQCPFCGERSSLGYVPKARKKYVQRPRPEKQPSPEETIKDEAAEEIKSIVQPVEEIPATEQTSAEVVKPEPNTETVDEGYVQSAMEEKPEPAPDTEPEMSPLPEPESLDEPMPKVESLAAETVTEARKETEEKEVEKASTPDVEQEDVKNVQQFGLQQTFGETVKDYFGKLFRYYQGDTKEKVKCEHDFNADGFYDDTPSLVPPTKLRITFRQAFPYIGYALLFLGSVIYFITLVV